MKKNIWIVVGTRPEVIKQVPAYWALKDHSVWNPRLVAVTQHQELLQQALDTFKCQPDLIVKVQRETAGDLLDFSSLLLKSLSQEFDREKPDAVMVQGDTSTAFLVAFGAFYRKIPVFHNEAGLRSYDLDHPFPEEANRRWISSIAKLNFAPTEVAKKALLNEGIDQQHVHIVGNSGIDSFKWALQQKPSEDFLRLREKWRSRNLMPILVTSHRRENSGAGSEVLYQSLARFLKEQPDLFLVCPLHPNGLARTQAEKFLSHLDRAQLIPPLDYVSICHLVNELVFAVTDSGGLQEECGSRKIPVVVARQTTERREVIDAGLGRLVPAEKGEDLYQALQWASQQGRSTTREWSGIYGDGLTGQKIAQILQKPL